MKFLHKILLLFFFCFRKLGSSHFVTNKPAQQTINKRCICWLQCPSEINKDLYDLTQQLSIRQIVCTQKHKEFPRNFWQKKPSVGRAEKLKPHEAIPPLSLIEVSIHGKKADTLEKTVQSWWLQLSPSLSLTIPTRTCAPFFTIVRGPPLSPYKLNMIDTKWMTLSLRK